MQDKPLDYRCPGTVAEKRGAVVSHHEDRSITISVRYPDKLRKELAIGRIISCFIAVGVPCLFFWLGGWRTGLSLAMLLGVVVPIGLTIMRDAFAEHEWLVRPEGITMARVDAKGRRRQRFVPRPAIRDVRIRFLPGGKGQRPKRYLFLKPPRWSMWSPTYFAHLGDDDLATVADAVREGLGMPPVTWTGWHWSVSIG